MQTDGSGATDAASDLVLDAAAVLYAGGQSTGMTLAAVDRLNTGLGTVGTLVPTWASLQLVGHDRTVRVAPGSPTGLNMRRVAATMAVVDRAQDGPLDADAVRDELASAKSQPISNTVLFNVACATGAGALAVIFGAQQPAVVLVAALSAALGGLARRGVARLHGDVLTQAFTAALIAGLVGVVADRLHVDDATGLVVLCPAMVLVPGPHILNGALDLLSLRVALGAARLGYAALILTAIATGLILGLGVGGLGIAVGQTGAPVPMGVDVLAAGIAAGSYPVFFSMPYRMIVWPVAIGMLVHAGHWWALTAWHVDLATAAFCSALIAGVLVVPIAHALRIPFAAVGFASVVALVPGVYVFRMLSGLVNFASAPTPELLAALASDGAVAALVVAGLASGLALPMHAYAVASANRVTRV